MLWALRWILYFVLISSGLKLLDVYVLSVYCPTFIPTVCAYVQNTVVDVCASIQHTVVDRLNNIFEYIFGWLLYRFGIWTKEIPNEVPVKVEETSDVVAIAGSIVIGFAVYFFPT